MESQFSWAGWVPGLAHVRLSQLWVALGTPQIWRLVPHAGAVTSFLLQSQATAGPNARLESKERCHPGNVLGPWCPSLSDFLIWGSQWYEEDESEVAISAFALVSFYEQGLRPCSQGGCEHQVWGCRWNASNRARQVGVPVEGLKSWFSFHRNAAFSPCYLGTYCGRYFYYGIYSYVELDTITIKITIECPWCARRCFKCIILLNPSNSITSVL